MTLPTWMLKLAAAATMTVIVGIGAAMSAPSLFLSDEDVTVHDSYRPGEFGVDYAAVTGPMGPGSGSDASADCASATWPNIPAECLQSPSEDQPRTILRSR